MLCHFICITLANKTQSADNSLLFLPANNDILYFLIIVFEDKTSGKVNNYIY